MLTYKINNTTHKLKSFADRKRKVRIKQSHNKP